MNGSFTCISGKKKRPAPQIGAKRRFAVPPYLPPVKAASRSSVNGDGPFRSSRTAQKRRAVRMLQAALTVPPSLGRPCTADFFTAVHSRYCIIIFASVNRKRKENRTGAGASGPDGCKGDQWIITFRPMASSCSFLACTSSSFGGSASRMMCFLCRRSHLTVPSLW